MYMTFTYNNLCILHTVYIFYIYIYIIINIIPKKGTKM